MVGSSREQDAGLVNQSRDQFHFHSLAQREFAHHHVHLVLHLQQFRQAADNLGEACPIDVVNGAIQLERFLRGQVPPERVFWPMSRLNCRFISFRRSQGIKPSTRAWPEVGFNNPRAF